MADHPHRIGDARSCGAATEEAGNDFVTVDGQLWAVDGDPDSHGDGGLNASIDWIEINGKAIIIAGDGAGADDLCPIAGGEHCSPSAVGFSDLIDIG